ncbi:reverse transcriptase family protein [Enterovibrio sp. ZSDZ42]|uniref:RNA-directed DNA polymerase n=1 Tax=Enterovibrio gelatinilyticus TaxID=2899819 RepID=A0ABT5R2G1_9GAMM|nr:reverse transcriptase family protein [Enterovibrio sp. ZSDZ42]MDD1794461.1 reverse transcriptase family protein [Enterovibrio sp. ZSDZ42]
MSNEQQNDSPIQDPSPKLTRQELYDRVRHVGKNNYILSEMTRLGFWQKNAEKPTLAEAFIEKRSSLQARLRELSKENALYSDPEKALKALHDERKKAALEKREQTKRDRNTARYKRAFSWYIKQGETFTYLGENVSAGLEDKTSQEDRLTAQKLPVFAHAGAVADAMGVSTSELRFLCYQKDVSTISHYQDFAITKKSGGIRTISAPMPRMKRAQYWLLDNVLNKLAVHDAAHGFVSGRSIVSNAEPHIKKRVVINLDMKDFFPSVSYKRVKGMFKQLGYSEELATTFALLTTKPATEALDMDGKTWHVAVGERTLPQGSPCSPAITNVLCRRLDARLKGMAEKLGFTYTRYADDLTFSNDDDSQVQALLWRCKQIVSSEGFVIHPDKTRVMRRHQKQEVTGVVVNDGLSVERKTLKRFRAVLKQVELDGPENKHWGHGELFQSLAGYANFVAMVNPEKGIPLQKSVIHIKRQHDIPVPTGKVSALNKKLFRIKAAKGETPREDWWQPIDKSAPTLELTPQQIQNKKREAIEEARQQYDGNVDKRTQHTDNDDSLEPGEKKHGIGFWIFAIIFSPIILIVALSRASTTAKIALAASLFFWMYYFFM